MFLVDIQCEGKKYKKKRTNKKTVLQIVRNLEKMSFCLKRTEVGQL